MEPYQWACLVDGMQVVSIEAYAYAIVGDKLADTILGIPIVHLLVHDVDGKSHAILLAFSFHADLLQSILGQ